MKFKRNPTTKTLIIKKAKEEKLPNDKFKKLCKELEEVVDSWKK
jgi:hypothetical protein